MLKRRDMCPRIKQTRLIDSPPAVTGFKPVGSRSDKEMFVEIHFEEYEALKLADYQNLSHLEASKKMGISRPTFTRIYNDVRKKLAQAFVEGLEIKILGGYVDFEGEWYRCRRCHRVFNTNAKTKKICPSCGSEEVFSLNQTIQEWRTMRGKRKQAMGITEYCICPECNTRIKHEYGVPCNTHTCPECGHLMVREQ